MKEATGELNMTVVTIIAIGAIIAFFWFMWPQIRSSINKQWGSIKQDADEGGHNNGIDGATDGATDGGASGGMIIVPSLW